jgi:hypothetical protein
MGSKKCKIKSNDNEAVLCISVVGVCGGCDTKTPGSVIGRPNVGGQRCIHR